MRDVLDRVAKIVAPGLHALRSGMVRANTESRTVRGC